MKNHEIISLFARHNFQVDEAALGYLQDLTDPVKLLALVNVYAPEFLVITMPLIRVLERIEHMNSHKIKLEVS